MIGFGWATDCVINAPKYSRLEKKHCWAHVSEHWLTFFNQLYKHRVVSTHSQPEAVLIPLDYHTALDQAWTPTKKTLQLCGSAIFLFCFVTSRSLTFYSWHTMRLDGWNLVPSSCRTPIRGISNQAQYWGTRLLPLSSNSCRWTSKPQNKKKNVIWTGQHFPI